MSSQVLEKRSQLVKEKAKALGFDFCGISRAEFLEEEAPKLENWLKQGMHGQMHYMENHFDKRLDPTKLVEGARSVVTLLYNYYPEEDLSQSDNYKISKYAYGQDYHFVIKDKLRNLVAELQEEIGEIEGRVFVDSAPVMERAWAKRSGVGWVGKNSLLLTKQRGSFFFLAEIISDLELQADGPMKDYCGTCTRCLDACPTDAIVAPYVVDGSRCISYYTIELKEEIPKKAQAKFENWIFGCDICQDVCPWNRHARPHQEPDFSPHPELRSMQKEDWEELTEEVFRKLFKKSAVKRTKYQGLQRNIRFVSDKKRPQ
ncbi:tRNA epoxyqueuosine(34) reductase QueG [Porifericola rhodea]|uniref:tRNA epoxyqueuosine(34) reductase QueG n=1 Tax=Porifericola rhodea TaxID=930972 RepID=UPI002664F54A|nr:tRNA epoxyqueuosine(34) reductase QueG [Porifericola rhodea]WKN32820.1 tRNA epoxyqueuosine(34) reductase QueG [Porifericola rhodea]